MGQRLSQGSASGRVAVITGGASGIGLATSRRCASLGMRVVLADICGPERLAAAQDEVRSAGVPGAVVIAVHCDVSQASSVEALKRRVYEDPALGEVAFLFSNAGVSRAESASVLKTPIESWERTFAVNVYGSLHCLRSFVPAMQAQRTDCVVVTTSSYCGLLNTSPGGFGSDVCYTASKHSLTILTEALAHELRLVAENKVAVHCLFPAGVQTNILNFAQHALLEDVPEGSERSEKLVAFAASRNRTNVEKDGLTADELVQVLQEGINDGKFYIRAFDKASSFNVLGAVILERAKDIVEQRDPISLEHPDPAKRDAAVAGIRATLQSQAGASVASKL